MKTWKILKIFGVDIPVFKIDGLIEDGAFGYYEDEDEHKYIAIDSKLSGEMATHTLVHEMFHATMDRLHIHQQLDEKFIEIIVENLTTALMENFSVKASGGIRK